MAGRAAVRRFRVAYHSFRSVSAVGRVGHGSEGVASPDLRGALPVDWPGCAVMVRFVFRLVLSNGSSGWARGGRG